MGVEVIDNFLPEEEFKSIQSSMMNSFIPWYYNECLRGGSSGYQFTHMFYDERPPHHGAASSHFKMFESSLIKLGAKHLHRIKANLNPKTLFKRDTGYHTDHDDEGWTSAVLYVNTNNGGTKFRSGKFVKSVENRMVVFDSNLVHAGMTCTNENTRVLVNFIYKK